MQASGTNSPETERGNALYFFPDSPVTADQLTRLLRDGSRERRAWAVSHLVRYADWEDIWTYIERDDVRELFADLDLPDGLRAAWARMLRIETVSTP